MLIINVISIVANNVFCDSYNPDIDPTLILYIDANNLYEHSMFQNLPTGNYKWEDPTNFDTFLKENEVFGCQTTLEKKSPKGYFVEVDIYYSDKRL